MHQCLKFILEWHSTCFGRSFRPSSGVQDCTYSNRQLSKRYCWLLASRQQYLFDKCLLLYVQSWTPDDGRNDRPKHVECHSKINTFENLVHLVGFTIEVLHEIYYYQLPMSGVGNKSVRNKTRNLLVTSPPPPIRNGTVSVRHNANPQI